MDSMNIYVFIITIWLKIEMAEHSVVDKDGSWSDGVSETMSITIYIFR